MGDILLCVLNFFVRVLARETLQVVMTCVQTQNLGKLRKNDFNLASTVCEKHPVGDCEKSVNHSRIHEYNGRITGTTGVVRCSKDSMEPKTKKTGWV